MLMAAETASFGTFERDITAAVAGATLTTVTQDYDRLDWEAYLPQSFPSTSNPQWL